MPEPRFDLSYQGLMVPGADPEEVRARLSQIFKLNDQGITRLFTGKPVIVKRDVDRAAAAQFERLFARAGAVLTVTPVEGGGTEPGSVAGSSQAAAEGPGRPNTGGLPTLPAGAALSLMPFFGDLEELPPMSTPDFDISYLSLVPGDDWTLEDCMPPPTLIPELDISYLSLVPITGTEEGPEDEPEYGRGYLAPDAPLFVR
jgi:hypothetical protein